MCGVVDMGVGEMGETAGVDKMGGVAMKWKRWVEWVKWVRWLVCAVKHKALFILVKSKFYVKVKSISKALLIISIIHKEWI